MRERSQYRRLRRSHRLVWGGAIVVLLVVGGTWAADGEATDRNAYFGDPAAVSSYAYPGVPCIADSSDTATFAPGTDSYFFLVVAGNGSSESSYGKDSTGTERPENVGTPSCDLPQELNATCN